MFGKTQKRIVLFCCLLLTITVSMTLTASLVQVKGQANSLVESPTANGQINWEKEVIIAKGYGALSDKVKNPAQAKLLGFQAAKTDAYRTLAEIVNGVRVTSETYVKNFVVASDEIRVSVAGFIQGATVIDKKQLDDGTFEVTMQLPLRGKEGIDGLLAPEIYRIDKNGGKSVSTFNFRKTSFNSRDTDSFGSRYTGLIVDATGLGAKPAISPKVLDDILKEIYGIASIEPTLAKQRGLVSYSRSLDTAKKLSRVGGNPLIIKAVGSNGTYKSNLVITQPDGKKIQDLNQELGFLQNASVVIVIN